MKNKRFFSIVLSIICAMALCVPIRAVESRASDQIVAYGMKVTPHSGFFSVYFSVTGTGEVDKLGCESIYVYEMIDMDWVLVESRLENASGMSSKNTYIHTNSVQCSTERGEAYKVVVTIFSENSKGRDTRSQTFYDIGQ